MSKFKKNQKIHFILTGSIAAYKSLEVISRLQQKGYSVQTLVTKNALQFVGAATLEGLTGKAPLVDTYETGKMMSHIHEIRSSDLIVVAPATANCINKISHGLADDLPSSFLLAHRYDKPLLIAPAMNTSMYEHPETQHSINKLKKWGATILEPTSGTLACGEIGPGRMIEPLDLFNAITETLNTSPTGKKILITSGGTSENIDSVRVLTNVSTGSTGVFLAEGLSKNGYDITLLRSEASKNSSFLPHIFNFNNFTSLEKQIKTLLQENFFDLIIHAAAVSDYHFAGIEGLQTSTPTHGKLSSEPEELRIRLLKNPKLVNELKKISKNKDIKLISFKLTDTDLIEIQKKSVQNLFEKSNSDLILQNDMHTIRNQTHSFMAYAQNQNNTHEPQFLENKESLLSFLKIWIKENV